VYIALALVRNPPLCIHLPFQSRWQQEMHFKLAKLANVCKELNDESSLRKLEANTLTQELRSVKMERDSVSEELFTLRAEMRLYEKHQQDLEAMKDKLTAQSAAVTARDATIADLTRKLERALTENELIKSQASQRRIIFPDSKR
jgi:septal ring factor EnvC (AmiA/AmiB activator)